ncbi:hypothetical protein D3C74_465380 [compost metagenome]
MLRTHGIEGISKTEIQTYDEWKNVLAKVFYEPLVNYTEQELRDIWDRIQAAHEDWKRTKLS